MKLTTSFPAFLFGIILLSACSSNEIGESKDVSQDKIYQSYHISYTEGNAEITLFSQFRFGGVNGTTLVLNDPSQVQLDGEKIAVDSSKAEGAFYQVTKPVAGFAGKHNIVFTNTDGKKIANSFSFDTFKLLDVPAAVSKKQSFPINFQGGELSGDDYIEVGSNNTDSSFSFSHKISDGANTITIPAKELQRQKVKQLMLNITLYRFIPLQQNTAEGGRLQIKYELKPITITLKD